MIDGELGTVAAVIDHQAARRPHDVAIVLDTRRSTFGEVAERSRQVAAGLAEAGVGRGDRVLVQMANGTEIIDIWFAVSRLGACFVPINTAYVGAYLEHQMRTSGARIIVVDAEFLEGVAIAAARIPSFEHIVVVGGQEVHASGGVAIAYDDLVASGGVCPEVAVGPSEPGAILFTAGTTGPSKGVVMSQGYLVEAARTMWSIRDGQPDDVCYNPLPLFHANAMLVGVLGPLAGGATSVVDRRFSVSGFAERVRAVGATQLCLLGSMITMVWDREQANPDALGPARVLFGAPVSPSIHRQFETTFKVRIVVAYGLTEATPLMMSSFDDPPPPGTSGRPNPAFEVRIVDDDGGDVEPNEVGELICRPRRPGAMFDGYFANEQATDEVIRDGWFHTGDLGSLDSHGWFRFADRKKDYMRRRGENISSFEVEEAVGLHPAVAEVAVHAVASEFTEDEVKACVVMRSGTSLTHDELFEHCLANIPYFAVPRYIEFVDELPRNPAGRVRKYELRDRGVTPDTWDREAAGLQVVRRG